MKAVFNSFIIAFSMYSKIPMPKVSWSKDNMRYVMCFFPLVGTVIGGLVYLWSKISSSLPFSNVFHTVILILIPLIITGGIHMDGYLDTLDALSSYGSKEKKLEILKDPHTGAFALIHCVIYFFLTYGIWYDVTPDGIFILSIGFTLSRALSGLSVVTFPLGKNTGLVNMFSSESKKKQTGMVMIVYILLCSAFMIYINTVLGLLAIISTFLVLLYYRYLSIKQFGGITGDLAGYFLQLCELIMAIIVIMGDRLWF